MAGCAPHGPLRIVLLAGILLAIGCMKVGPNFAPPPVEVAKDWMAVDDQRLTVEAVETRTWWRGFEDPLLDELIQTAYRQNLSLRSAGVRVLEARAQLGAVVG
jgi:outer membrane protein TolC